ncbi:MAG: hypothetical protein JXA99_14210 [Candidatus Lokiarchaeota archaeon]|nr:hypothetical protein [Candidatus Lokiarchaeota archaeon]
MYLFEKEKIREISIKCKLCLEEVKFKVSMDEYRNTKKFPIKKENVHGDPKHKIIVSINKNLEIDNFKIENLSEKEATAVVANELTKQVLHDIGLSDVEIELYLKSTGRDAISLGEMAILINKPKEDCKSIALKFVEKGLFKEIIGATPHYTPLPPYAALLAQLKDFHSYISNIKDVLPTEVDKSFQEFESSSADKSKIKEAEGLIHDIRDNMLTKIDLKEGDLKVDTSVLQQVKDITKDLGNVEGMTQGLVTKQIDEMKKQFETINSKSAEIIQAQVDELSGRLSRMKETISNNLGKLKLGVVQSSVNQLVEKIVSNSMKEIQDGLDVQLSVNEMVFSEELNDTIGNLDKEFTNKFKDSIEGALKGLDGMSIQTTGDTQAIFDKLGGQFSEAVKVAEDKINAIYGDVIKSLGGVKELITQRVINTIDSTLAKILKKLEMQESMTEEFWDQAKKVSTLTMKDIWFIRSPEAAKAHIIEELSRAKMRILIVAPEITDIDLEAIKERPSRINIRIAASIDVGNPEHKQILNELDKLGNVQYRDRGLKNLWGINKDYEEVILCVLSKIDIAGVSRTEIAGIGSIIEEHIKIFVPILEDAWVGAQKHIAHTKKKSSKSEAPIPIGLTRETTEGLIEEPKNRLPPLEIKPTEKPQIEPEVPKKPVEKVTPKKNIVTEISDLKKLYDEILASMDDMNNDELASELELFHNSYIKIIGYNNTIKQIFKKTDALKAKDDVMSKMDKVSFKKFLTGWKKNLDLL